MPLGNIKGEIMTAKRKRLTICMLVFSLIAIFAMSGLVMKGQKISMGESLGIGQQMSSVVVDTEEDNSTPPFNEDDVKIPTNAKTLGDIILPEGWEWVDDPATKLTKGTKRLWIKYVGEDKDNYTTTEIQISITITEKSTPTNPWMIVIYIMIPWNAVMTIVYIIHMRKMRFRKKFIDQQEEPEMQDFEEEKPKKRQTKKEMEQVEEAGEIEKPKKRTKKSEE